jgi:hypothetical protein
MAASEPSHIEGKFGWFLSHLVNMSNTKQLDNMITVEDFFFGADTALNHNRSPALLQGSVLENTSIF